jgi:hypothetical protein
LWTTLMAVAIACDATAIAFMLLGGGGIGWLLAFPLMFFGLQILGLPVVLVCELAERIRIVRRAWRPLVDEILIVGCLCLLGFWWLPKPVAIGFGGLFSTMYLLRLLARKSWIPGEAVEVES